MPDAPHERRFAPKVSYPFWKEWEETVRGIRAATRPKPTPKQAKQQLVKIGIDTFLQASANPAAFRDLLQQITPKLQPENKTLSLAIADGDGGPHVRFGEAYSKCTEFQSETKFSAALAVAGVMGYRTPASDPDGST